MMNELYERLEKEMDRLGDKFYDQRSYGAWYFVGRCKHERIKL